MVAKVTPMKLLLSKWYVFYGLCFCVHVCFVCSFACGYINIGLRPIELLKIEIIIIIIVIILLLFCILFASVLLLFHSAYSC
jgi:hypothetical protein